MMSSVKKVFEMLSDMFSKEEGEKDSAAMLIENAKNEIREIRAQIDSSHDEEVIEMCIYKLKIAENQYRELLKMVKANRKKTG